MSCLASQVAELLRAELRGPDVAINGPRSLDAIGAGALVFAKSMSPERIATLNGCPGALALVSSEFSGELFHSHIIVANPRLAFAHAVSAFFMPDEAASVAATALVHPTARVPKTVSVGDYSVIGADVHLGEGTRIRCHAVIAAGTRIGSRCLVKSHVVVGEDGFGFDFDEDGTPIRIPHLGGVIVGDDVEIGAGSVIARGTLDMTRIGDRVKIDDLVFIAHNVVVGEDTLIIASAEVSGSVRVGRGCWIGPSASIINGVSIGDGALVGIGAVVTKDVEPGVVVAGNPARVLRMRNR